MCPICKTSDNGKHHYNCPLEYASKVLAVVSKERMELQYKNYIKWRRDDGKYYIMANK